MEQLAETLTSNGAVGICIAMLIYMYYKDRQIAEMFKEHSKVINDHFEWDKKSRREEIDSRLEIAKALTILARDVPNCPQNFSNKIAKKKP